MRVRCDRHLLEEGSPLLIYGEAAAGKTLAALALASWYTRVTGGLVYLVTTEPQNTLPLASMVLSPESLIYTVFSLEELAEVIVEAASGARRGDIIVVDTLTAPYRVEAGDDPSLANRLLTFAAAILAHIAHLGIASIAVSQVHVDPETGRLEPPGYTLIRGYMGMSIALVKNGARRVGIDEDNNVIFELIIEGRGEAELICKRRYSSY